MVTVKGSGIKVPADRVITVVTVAVDGIKVPTDRVIIDVTVVGGTIKLPTDRVITDVTVTGSGSKLPTDRVVDDVTIVEGRIKGVNAVSAVVGGNSPYIRVCHQPTCSVKNHSTYQCGASLQQLIPILICEIQAYGRKNRGNIRYISKKLSVRLPWICYKEITYKEPEAVMEGDVVLRVGNLPVGPAKLVVLKMPLGTVKLGTDEGNPVDRMTLVAF